MTEWWVSFLRAPKFEDEDSTRIAGLLQVAILIASLLVSAAAIAALFIPDAVDNPLPIFGAVGVQIGLLFAIRRGHVRFAAVTLPVIAWLLITWIAFNGAGIYDTILSAYVIVIVIAGLVIGPRAVLYAGVLVLLTTAAMLVIPPRFEITQDQLPINRLEAWLDHAVAYILTMLMLALASRNITLALERARRGERRLKEETGERERIEEAYQRIVENSLQGLVIVENTRIVFTNSVMEKLTGCTRTELFALESLFPLIHPDDQPMLVENLRRRQAGDTAPYHYEIRLIHRTGRVVWVEVYATPIEYRARQMIYAALIDITERKQAAAALEANRQIEHEFREKLKALHETTIALSQADSLDTLYRRAIELGRERLGFDRLGLFLLDAQTGESVGTYGTDETGQLRDEKCLRRKFDTDTRVSEVLRSKERVRIWADVSLYDNWQTVGQGWNAMASLWNGDQVIGWLAADNLIHQQPAPPYLPDLMTLYGAALGHLITRKQAETALEENRETDRWFREKLKALHEVTAALSKADTLDALYRGAIEMGRERLGFDRLGLFLFDKETDDSIGTYGVNARGELAAISHLRFKLGGDGRVAAMLNARERVQIWQDVPLFDGFHPVGHGWNGVAALWTGDEAIGWLAADNLIHQQPVHPYHAEILASFGVSLGHLIMRKRAEIELQNSEQRFASAFRANPSAISITSMVDGRALDVNASYMRLTGYSREETLGRTAVDLNLYVNPGERSRVFEILRRDGRVLDFETTIRKKSGAVIHALMSVEEISVQGERYYLAMLQDITALKEAEQRRLELALERERFELLQEFIGNISHDLKTPLSVINTSLYLLERMTDPQKQQEKLDNIKTQTLLLEKYIQDILTISRLDHTPGLALQPVDLNALLQEIAQRLRPSAERKYLDTALDLDSSIPPIMADRQELDRALSNLVENAFIYTPERGTVRVRTRVSEDYAIAEVSDTGIGISEADLHHIFERFYRADKARSVEKGGTGLGLAIAKRIVDMHSGSIEVESRLGEGTTFRVTLPAVQ